MWVFNEAFGKLFEILFFPFQRMTPWAGMVFISFLTGLLMLWIFRLFSNQQGIRRVKNRIKAHLLELRLFKDNLSLSLKAYKNILRYNLKYMGYSAKPMLVMIIPLILILIQLNLWFSYQALKPGEATLLKVKLGQDQNPLQVEISPFPSSGLLIETPPLRLEEEREISWRIRATEKGTHEIQLRLGNQTISKKVIVEEKPLAKISSLKVGGYFWNQLLNPGEPPLPKNIPLRAVEIRYPHQSMNFFGLKIHWLIAYFVLSIAFGFGLKSAFKVEI